MTVCFLGTVHCLHPSWSPLLHLHRIQSTMRAALVMRRTTPSVTWRCHRTSFSTPEPTIWSLAPRITRLPQQPPSIALKTSKAESVSTAWTTRASAQTFLPTPAKFHWSAVRARLRGIKLSKTKTSANCFHSCKFSPQPLDRLHTVEMTLGELWTRVCDITFANP